MLDRPKRKAAEKANEGLTTTTTRKQSRRTSRKRVESSPDEAPPPKRTKRNAQPSATSAKKSQKAAAGRPDKADISEASDHAEGEEETARFWLLKAEPESRVEMGVDVKFSIDDLQAKGESSWDGVRSFEARNIMRDKMKVGDKCFFYHSNCKTPGIAGIAEVSKEAYPDFTAVDSKHPYYDPKSDPDNPKWMMVNVKFVRKLRRLIPLKELQSYRDGPLSDMVLVRRGRLSVQPVKQEEWEFVLGLEDKDPE
ncbi:Thymocyte nuclear protein 1 [Borealophlyctis nickersoniae]|nr:Thymocyte nuclear protein 1 [Borealophlyctis nickersoniae]